MLDLDLLRAFVFLSATDAAGVHEIDLHRAGFQQLEEAIALLGMKQREEGIGSRNAKRFARLRRPARARALRLAEHEVRSGLRAFELRNDGDDVLVAVEDEEEIRLTGLHRIGSAFDVRHANDRAAVRRVRRVEVVDLAGVIL